MTTDELKPCPFCGNAIIRDYHVRDGRAVHCVKCGASMTAFNPDALKEAAKAWNTRTPYLAAEDIALREREARLVEALRGIKADCLDRAKFSRDGQTVPIGDGAWRGLCAVLAEIEKEANGAP